MLVTEPLPAVLAGQIVGALDARCKEAHGAEGKRWQSALLSATLHDSLGQLVSLSLKDPVSVGLR